MTARLTAVEWYEIVSIDLGNATDSRDSDKVGCVRRWRPPNAFEGITTADLLSVQQAIDGKDYR